MDGRGEDEVFALECAGFMTDEVEPLAAMMAAVDAANARIAACHEVVGCPKCGAPVGERCRRVTRYGWRVTQHGDPLKHPHRERWTLVQPAR